MSIACGCKVDRAARTRAALRVLSRANQDDPYALHLAALRQDLDAICALLPSSREGGHPADDAAGRGGATQARVAHNALLTKLRTIDAFGLSPSQRAREAFTLSPKKQWRFRERFGAVLLQLLTAEVLLDPLALTRIAPLLRKHMLACVGARNERPRTNQRGGGVRFFGGAAVKRTPTNGRCANLPRISL